MAKQHPEEGRHRGLAEGIEGSDRGRYFHARHGRILQATAKLAGGTEQRPADRVGVEIGGQRDNE